MDQFFTRAGAIRLDPKTGKNSFALHSGDKKIKIYRDESGEVKGDALISYNMIESVDIATDMLDGIEIVPGFKLSVAQAEFK